MPELQAGNVSGSCETSSDMTVLAVPLKFMRLGSEESLPYGPQLVHLYEFHGLTSRGPQEALLASCPVSGRIVDTFSAQLASESKQ